MSYTEHEVSNEGGQPAYLYAFQLGNTFWRYTSADQPLTIEIEEEEVTFLPVAISDAGVTQGGSDQNDLQVTLPADLPVAQLFRATKPSGKMFLTVRSVHVIDGETEAPVHWIGSVTNSILVDRASATLHARSIAGTYDRNGLRLPWSRSCPHVLYGIGCYVEKDDHAYPHEIATKTGTNFTVATFVAPAEGSFSGGFMEWDRGDGSLERLGIELQEGNDFRVFGSTAGLEIGQDVILYPGCARNTTNCKLFDNLPNYGGFPHLPGRSPFDGSPVF